MLTTVHADRPSCSRTFQCLLPEEHGHAGGSIPRRIRSSDVSDLDVMLGQTDKVVLTMARGMDTGSDILWNSVNKGVSAPGGKMPQNIPS